MIKKISQNSLYFNIASILFISTFPLMYYPKIFDGDTQPWILIGALFLIPLIRFSKNDLENLVLIVLGIFCIITYIIRSDDIYLIIRNTYIYLAFLVFWLICNQQNIREKLTMGVKFTVVAWFIVGLSQYIRVYLGYEINPSGRYLLGRMGPPSMTAEASYYGSLSVLQIMYLVKDVRRNIVYICMALISAIISGSFLSMLLLIYPLIKICKKYLFIIAAIVLLLMYISLQFYQWPLPSRVVDIFGNGLEVEKLFQDASLNLRFGHIYFTMYESFKDSIFLINNIDFMNEYNNYANNSNILIATGSDYILPAIGDLMYGGGIFGLFILLIILKHAWSTCLLFRDRLLKVFLIISLMLSPISLSNIFLIVYITQKE